MCARLASIENGSAIAHGSNDDSMKHERQHELLELQRCASQSKLAAALACSPRDSAVLLHLSAEDEATIHCRGCRAEEARTRTHARTREYP
jgi:hypothetical protein